MKLILRKFKINKYDLLKVFGYGLFGFVSAHTNIHLSSWQFWAILSIIVFIDVTSRLSVEEN